MARVDRHQGARIVVAETDDEFELLRYGRSHGGEIVLMEGYYLVVGEALLLPEAISVRGARQVCTALEQAALSHREAQRRRQQFHLVKRE